MNGKEIDDLPEALEKLITKYGFVAATCKGGTLDIDGMFTYSDRKPKYNSNNTAPPHYTRLKPQPKDVQIAWNLPAFLFCVLKYIARAGYKDSAIADLEKAKQYLDFEIERLKKDGLE